MDQRREEFLARLRETFRVEAAEHLAAIEAGLLAAERAPEAERGPLVERAFREAHSLKGAARSVSLPGVEALCVELEYVFSAAKRGQLALSTDVLDALRPALRVVASGCEAPGAAPTPDTEQRERVAVAALKRIVRGADKSPEAQPACDLPLPGEPSPAHAPVAPPATARAVAAEATPAQVVVRDASPSAVPSTVRVSMQKLGAILLEAEELVGAKLASSARASELRALAAELASWNQRRTRELATLRQRRDRAAAASELLESGSLYTRALENSLRKLAALAHQDATSLAARSDRLLDDAKKSLLLPCSYLFGPLPGVCRELAREQGKFVDVRVYGDDLEIDRRILDALNDPLLHLLRNCIDHGIEAPAERRAAGKPEAGSVSIVGRALDGNRIEFTVADDGRGIDVAKVRAAAVRLEVVSKIDADALGDAEALELVFRSGLSTSPILTDLSGRGLGLAIAREKVQGLGGTITVASNPGGGTSFRFVVPSSLATFRGVFVEVAGRTFVLPTAGVVRVARAAPAWVKTVENRQTVTLQDRAVSLVRLKDVLGVGGTAGRADAGTIHLVVIRAGQDEVALAVDEVLGEQEVMVRALGSQLPRVRNLAGGAISGGGAVVPILDVPDLVTSAIAVGSRASATSEPGAEPRRRARVCVAEDSITSRTLVKSILEGAGYDVTACVDGLDAFTRLKTDPFDLVVSDVDMPRMNGFELTARIRADKKLSETPVVLVTALASQKDREYGIEVGANAYLIKSDFDQSNLLEIVRRLL